MGQVFPGVESNELHTKFSYVAIIYLSPNDKSKCVNTTSNTTPLDAIQSLRRLLDAPNVEIIQVIPAEKRVDVIMATMKVMRA